MIIINFFKKYPLMIFIPIFSIPLLISAFMFLPWFSYSKGNVDGWLGFWGSYLGGTIGTLGVIATTYFLIKHETEISNGSIVMEDKRKRDMMLLEIKMKKNEEITESVIKLNDIKADLHNAILQFSIAKEKYLYNEPSEENKKNLMDNLWVFYNTRKIFIDQLNRLILQQKTFHNDEVLINFIESNHEFIDTYNHLSRQVRTCEDINLCTKYTEEIEKNILGMTNEYNKIITFYSKQYKTIINSINNKGL